MNFSRHFVTPYFTTAKAKKKPESMRPTPQTQSWFWKMPIRSADGTPKRKPAEPTAMIACFRVRPRSMRMRDASSIIATRLDQAANTRARKKRAMKNWPPGICAKSCGTQMKVRPSLPAPTISPAASGITEKIVQSTMMPARSDIELLPNPMTKALSAVSSRARMYTA